MKSKTLLAVFLLSCLLFSGCGGSAAETPPAAASPTAALADPDIAACVESVTYRGLSADKQDAALTDAEYDYALNALLTQHATTEKITDRCVEDGDTINLDYIAMKDGTLITDFWKDGAELTVGSNATFEAFETALIGRPCNQDFTVEAVMPESISAEYGGQTVQIMVIIHYIESDPILPELTDEFVSSLDGWNCSTVDEFKAAFRSYLEENKADYCESQYKDALWTQVLDGAVITDAGEAYIDAYRAQQEGGFRSSADASGTTLDELAANYGYDTGDDLMDAVGQTAAKQAKTILAMKYIAAAEGIAYTDDEYYDAVDDYAAQMGFDNTTDLISAYGVDDIKETVGNSLLYDKVLDFVAANAA